MKKAQPKHPAPSLKHGVGKPIGYGGFRSVSETGPDHVVKLFGNPMGRRWQRWPLINTGAPWFSRLQLRSEIKKDAQAPENQRARRAFKDKKAFREFLYAKKSLRDTRIMQDYLGGYIIPSMPFVGSVKGKAGVIELQQRRHTENLGDLLKRDPHILHDSNIRAQMSEIIGGIRRLQEDHPDRFVDLNLRNLEFNPHTQRIEIVDTQLLPWDLANKVKYGLEGIAERRSVLPDRLKKRKELESLIERADAELATARVHTRG